jgi:hypothetical protein
MKPWLESLHQMEASKVFYVAESEHRHGDPIVSRRFADSARQAGYLAGTVHSFEAHELPKTFSARRRL